jgi:Pup amidohydrolase
LLPDGGEIIVHKNNSDGKGNSYGCHENYLLARETRSDGSPARSPRTS